MPDLSQHRSPSCQRLSLATEQLHRPSVSAGRPSSSSSRPLSFVLLHIIGVLVVRRRQSYATTCRRPWSLCAATDAASPVVNIDITIASATSRRTVLWTWFIVVRVSAAWNPHVSYSVPWTWCIVQCEPTPWTRSIDHGPTLNLCFYFPFFIFKNPKVLRAHLSATIFSLLSFFLIFSLVQTSGSLFSIIRPLI